MKTGAVLLSFEVLCRLAGCGGGGEVVVQVAVIDTVFYQVDVTSSPPAVTHNQGNYNYSAATVTQAHFFQCSLPHLIHP